jgi:hypothetical protein
MAQQNQNSITWEAHEFRHYEKGSGWYFTSGAICLLIIGYFAIQRDFFASVSLAIIAGFMFYFARQVPDMVEIELNSKNIRFGNLVFPYQQIKHFWIVNKEHHKTLNLHTTAVLNSIIILELEGQDPDEVRDFLLRYLPEHQETEETMAQRIMHRFKF